MKRLVGVGWSVKTTPMSRVSTENVGWEDGDVSMPSSIHATSDIAIREEKIIARSVFIVLIIAINQTENRLRYCFQSVK